MKQKIYIKLFEGAEPLVIKEQGDWIDLKKPITLVHQSIGEPHLGQVTTGPLTIYLHSGLLH